MVSRTLVKPITTDFINSFNIPKSDSYCSDCAIPLIKEYHSIVAKQKGELVTAINKDLDAIPIITSHSPLNWDYQVVDMVSAQSVSGTGFLTEFTSSWTDLTGGQSASMASKVSSGEEICKQKLRYQCALIKGNAVLATDIDYSEVGGAKGMLMVCMAGTAVQLNLSNGLFSDRKERIENIQSLVADLNKLSGIKFPDLDYQI